ncbi:tetratricopeptide (TPR) repeat protein [Rhodopirellula rubra]|uniref:Tetratricopeptide (TPR) repeat protein n=1 Tax=Aporhodopirellula rubra TaxID=980271 RepID=A0A7W5H5Y7_9BACT|nr:FG-GAP-like repeat-containing protein [Aporhodopirellula rubra]MBB3206904.1 tetratricopeptide (TPR) repeat protein [Aporhodopirellula rubra]
MKNSQRRNNTIDHRHATRDWFLGLLIIVALVGCQQTVQEFQLDRLAEPEDALARLRSAIHRQDWQEANEVSPSVLMQYHDDANAIELAAKAAHGNGTPDVAADLMSDACRIDSFSDPSRTNRALAAHLAIGRVFDCIDLLESSIKQQPDQHSIRRMLYQMCWGVEDRPRSIPHGQYLVRKRQFDLDLLLEMSQTEARAERSDSLVEMATRHPRDKRPLVAEARIQFDRGDFDQAIEILHESLQYHPEYPPSLAILSRALVDSGRYNEFAQLVPTLPKTVENYSFYWLAIGDWCRDRQLHTQAARAYWEAVQKDADIRESWFKLSTSLTQLSDSHAKLSPETISAVEERVILLTRFTHLRSQFLKSGKKSRDTLVEIAETARDLGRLWEAEAWTSIAMTFPDEGSVDVKPIRDSIVRQLRRDTPWQIIDSREEMKLDLSHLPLPRISVGSFTASAQPNRSTIRTSSTARINLVDQADASGLQFFGRTSDHLDQPGVMHYQTLGCGGGAIDFDLDGWSDLYLAAAGGTPPYRESDANALWRNLDGTFADVTGVTDTGDTGFSQGVAVGDVNEDGFADVLVLNYGPNTLLINNGDGTFTDSSSRLDEDASKTTWSSCGAIADLNNDGLADLTILSYGEGIDAVTRECRQETTNIVRACSPLIFPGATDCFQSSTGAGEFSDQTENWKASPSVVGRGLGVTVGSFDNEPGVDIFIANDLTSNHYWSPSTKNGFQLRESAILRGLGSDDRSPGQGSMGMATADFDRDGDIDFYITNFLGESNTYHEHASGGLWRDQTAPQDLLTPTLPFVGFGTEAIDLDNDGVLELVVANGHIDMYPGEDAAPYAQQMQIFQRSNEGGYRSIGPSIESEYLLTPHVGRALWTIDFNRDGLTDFAVTHQTEPVALLANQTSDAGNWIEFQIKGRDCSRDAIGATLQLHSGDQNWIVPLTSGDGFLCSNERIIRVGLGNLADNCSAVVVWADGTKQSFESLTPNATWLLVERDEDAFRLAHP